MRIVMILVLALLGVGAGVFYFATLPSNRTVKRLGAPTGLPPAKPAEPAPSPSPPSSPEPAPAPPEPQPRLPQPTPQPAVEWTAVEKQVLDLTNAERAKAGLHLLAREDGLCLTARFQSTDMIVRNFFDHVNPSGDNPADRIEKMHRRLVGLVGENIWKGEGPSYPTDPKLAEKIVQAWMHSPGHRANILRASFDHLGVGVVIRGEIVMATQNFAKVRAYLNDPLPEHMAAGSPVNLASDGPPPGAERYDLQPVKGPERPDNWPVAGAKLTAPPGEYRLRLFFLSGNNSYSIFEGPRFRIE